MKFRSSVTAHNGVHYQVEAEAADAQEAMRVMLAPFPRKSTVSLPKAVDQAGVVLKALAVHASEFPLMAPEIFALGIAVPTDVAEHLRTKEIEYATAAFEKVEKELAQARSRLDTVRGLNDA